MLENTGCEKDSYTGVFSYTNDFNYPDSKNNYLLELVVLLSVLQIFLSTAIPVLKIFQIPVEILIGVSLLYIFSNIKLDRLQLVLIFVFLVVSIISLWTTDTATFLINLKQNGLGVLSLICFSKIRYRSKLVFPLFIISLLMLLIHRYDYQILRPLVNLTSKQEFNLSRFGGVFFNAHFNACVIAIVLLYYSHRKKMYGLESIILLITASKTVFVAYIVNQLSRLPLVKSIIKYRELLIILLLIGLYFLYENSPKLIEYFQANIHLSAMIILMQLTDPAYYTMLLNPFPTSAIDVSQHSSVFYPNHSGDNEIGYFAIATQSGIFLGAVYLIVLLKYAKHYRIFILLILLHQQYFYSPLILYMIMSYSREISYHKTYGVKSMQAIKMILHTNQRNR